MTQKLEEPFSHPELESAYAWLCRQRKAYPVSSDIWPLRANWSRIREALLGEINAGDYCFSPLAAIKKSNGSIIHLWCSQDALVMKLLANRLNAILDLSDQCVHVKGHGGLKSAINLTQNALPSYRFVCKTDVKSFYESIDQHILLEQIDQQIKCKVIKQYLWQVITRVVDKGGNILTCKHGISRGSALSPILGALYLKRLDDAFEKTDTFYLRYMDDILILSKTRWQNRRAIRQLNECFNELKVSKHPDKTYFGKIESGFDFLGYHFNGKTLSVAHNTRSRYQESIRRLYEQQVKKNANPKELAIRLNLYSQRWKRWCKAGLWQATLSIFYEYIPVHTSPSPIKLTY